MTTNISKGLYLKGITEPARSKSGITVLIPLQAGLSAGIKKGRFTVLLNGEKLKGAYVFQKLKKENEWLVIKKEEAMPAFIAPMLATSAAKPFDKKGWIFEVKWDGYRALAFINGARATLKSRSDHLLSYPSIVEELQEIKEKVVLDGEIVVLDKNGVSKFQLLQNFKEDNLFYYVFDILFKDGNDLRTLPLIEENEF